ncbi:hypothetical protein F5148DRAFT_1278817 [Russula earlei]|uniref:Uncharacterized protein n=1 Tax=Russula earlei TaxID=71964 RepID=A0ACC0UPC9_9AGAM|nr:hypothetical protein F5148DRAFT_1278817 [Russula earlei]
MAHFFPAASRLDVERTPSLNRRASSRNLTRGHGDNPSSDGRPSRPSNINWLQNSSTTTQVGPSMPRRPPSVRLGRSASLSALGTPPPTLHRQSSLNSNHSLQLSTAAAPRTGNPAATSAHPTAKQLSPISERSYIPTPKREQYSADVEPSTPVSIGSSYSAFLRRPLKRSISATSTSSLRTNASTHPPTLPPLSVSPSDMRPTYPPVSHRAGQQLVSTVYEDAGSERTGSFVTARSVSDDGEDAEDTAVAPDSHGPSNSTILSPSNAELGNTSDLLADADRATEGTTLSATLPGGSSSGGLGGSGSGYGDGSSSSGPVPPARPRPRKRMPTSGGTGSTSSTFIWRRWTRDLSFGSGLSRPSFSAARRAIASRLPPLPILLFWAGFLAPWCWLIGGWLIAEGRWEDSGKARAALPLWKPRTRRPKQAATAKAKGHQGKEDAALAGGPQLPPDSLGTDLERGDAAPEVPAQEGQPGAVEGARDEALAVGPSGARRRFWAPYTWRWIPFVCSRHGADAAVLDTSPDGEKVVTLARPYSAEVWVYRCRLAAVMSAIILLIALIVAVVVIGGLNSSR